MDGNPQGLPQGPQDSAAPGRLQGCPSTGDSHFSAAPTNSQGRAASGPPLGIGFPWLPGLPDWLYRPDLIDFVEVTPETLCQERDGRSGRRLVLQQPALDAAREACAGLPMVIHGVELSIGSSAGWNAAYLDMLAEFQHHWPFAWHSEHLGFQCVRDTTGAVVDVGVPLPMPATQEAAALVTQRARAIAQRFEAPFLLENPAHYFAEWPADGATVDEIGLMNQVTEDSGCWQLLDLHNLYCNAVNIGLDIEGALARLNLAHVLEIHVAGGMWQQGWWADAHSGRVPEPVWQLLANVLPRCPNVRGVVFEVLDLYAPRLDPHLLAGQLERARAVWQAACVSEAGA